MIERGELRVGNYVLAGKLGPCRILNVFGIGEVSLIQDNGTLVDDYVKTEDLEGIEVTPEILVKFGFEPEMDTVLAEFEWRLETDEDNHLRIRDFFTNFDEIRPWSVHIDNGDMDSVGNGEFKYLHQLQNLVSAIIGEELDPIGDLGTVLLLMERRIPFDDALNSITNISLEKELGDPWWDDFGKIVTHDECQDYLQFCETYRGEYYTFFDDDISLDQVIGDPKDGEDQFSNLWMANEDFYEYSGDLEGEKDMTRYKAMVYRCNIMCFVLYAMCTEDDEAYQWLQKCITE
jgi:hypothetical protein